MLTASVKAASTFRVMGVAGPGVSLPPRPRKQHVEGVPLNF